MTVLSSLLLSRRRARQTTGRIENARTQSEHCKALRLRARRSSYTSLAVVTFYGVLLVSGTAREVANIIKGEATLALVDTMTFRDQEHEGDAVAAVPSLFLAEDHEEQAPAVEPVAALPSKGEDPVRLYLKEIGKVPLLTARQEVEIGRRIEVGQIALRRALAGIPMAVTALLDVGDRLRHEAISADDVIVLPAGGEIDAGSTI